MSTREIDVTKFIELLGSLWASKSPYITDYACNEYADVLAELDELIMDIEEAEGIENKEEIIEEIKRLRERIKRRGEAEWIKNSDVLTQLAIKTGRRTRVVKVGE